MWNTDIPDPYNRNSRWRRTCAALCLPQQGRVRVRVIYQLCVTLPAPRPGARRSASLPAAQEVTGVLRRRPGRGCARRAAGSGKAAAGSGRMPPLRSQVMRPLRGCRGRMRRRRMAPCQQSRPEPCTRPCLGLRQASGPSCSASRAAEPWHRLGSEPCGRPCLRPRHAGGHDSSAGRAAEPWCELCRKPCL